MLYKNKHLFFLRLFFSLDEPFHNAGKMNYSSPFIVHFFQIIIDSDLFKDAGLFILAGFGSDVTTSLKEKIFGRKHVTFPERY